MSRAEGREPLASPSPIDTTAAIETPEHVLFRFRVAGPAPRAVAYLIDTLLRFGVLAFVGTLVAAAGLYSPWSGYGYGTLLLVAFLLDWFYFVVCELMMAGQSPGKRAIGLRVVNRQGRPLGVGDSLLRNLLRAADFLPMFYGVGCIVSGFDPHFRRLGDWVAGTFVVWDRTATLPEPIVLSSPPSAEELAGLPNVPLEGELLEGIEVFLRRRAALNPVRALELAQLLSPRVTRELGAGHRNPERVLELAWLKARGQS
jgi:uncharacterized RDD family membrane protein YckC